MAEVKITELPASVVPNDSTVVPCVLQGTTRQLSLEHLKDYMDVPTIYVKLVQAVLPIETTPSTGIAEEGTIRIRESSPDTPGTMSIEHYNKVQNATNTSIGNLLVIRDGQGSFEANNITLRAPGSGDTDSGTLTGNLTQRKGTDVGVNAKLGETLRYSAKVTTLDAQTTANVGTSLSVSVGPLTVGGETNVKIESNGKALFSNDVTVNGNLFVTGSGKEIRGAVNTTGTAFPGRFTTLNATTSLDVVGPTTLNGAVQVKNNLTFDAGKVLNAPEGSLSAAFITATDKFMATTYEAPQGQSAVFKGTLQGSATSLTTGQLISLGGVLNGSSGVAFNGTSPAILNAGLNDGIIKNRHLAADSEIEDNRLKTLKTGGKVANSATTANSANVANTIVVRNGSGDFSAGTISATRFAGTADVASSLNGSATAENYTWTGLNYFQGKPGGVLTETNHKFQIYNTGSNGAVMSFHRNGAYAVNLGLDSDNVFRLGGWSDGSKFRWTADTAGNFTARGNVTAYSDETLKTNWRGLTEEFVEKLSKVKAGIFDRVDAPITQIGVSAQSLKEVTPEGVLEGSDGKLSVAYGNVALAACVALAKEICSLKEEIKALKAREV